MNRKTSGAGKHLQEIRNHRRWMTTVAVLALLVCVGTFFSLRHYGIAQTYQKRVLDCQEVSGTVSHVHNDDCYYNGELVCTLEEIEPHEHTSACYAEEPVLICPLMENDGHHHTDACYYPMMELACGLEETDGDEEHPAHYHTADCYRPVMELICGLEETAGDEEHPAHWHSEECY